MTTHNIAPLEEFLTDLENKLGAAELNCAQCMDLLVTIAEEYTAHGAEPPEGLLALHKRFVALRHALDKAYQQQQALLADFTLAIEKARID